MALLLQLDYRSRPRVICDCFPVNFMNIFYRSSYPVEQLSVTASGSPEAATGGVLLKKLFLKISQYSQENTCVLKLIFIKKRLQQRCFLVNITKFLRTPFLKNTCKRQRLAGSFLELLSNHGLLNSVCSKSWRDSFHANAPFQYPVNTSEKQMFSDVFRGYKNITLP